MDIRHGKPLALAIAGLLALGVAPEALAFGGRPPSLPHAWHPPAPPMPSVTVHFPPLVWGAPYYPTPVYHDRGPRHYVRHDHYYYGEGHGHHGHGHHGHHGHHDD